MHALANLGARPYQRVAVYHGPLVHVGPGVDEHRRHTNHAWSDVSAVANAGSARDDPHAIVCRKFSEWISVLVEKLQTAIRRRHVDNHAHAKAQQNAALDPGIRLPLPVRIALSSANLSAIEGRFEFSEYREVRVGVCAGFASCQLLDLATQWHGHSPANQ